MALTRKSLALRGVLPGSVRWALVGYVLPAILLGLVFLLIRNGPASAQPYNYGLILFVVLLLSASIAVVCLVAAVVLAVQSLRVEPIAPKWPHYAVLSAAFLAIVVSAIWLA
jgi:hypothetical protein